MTLSKAAKSYLQALKSKKFRQKYRQFLVEGDKPFAELLSSGWSISKVYATSAWLEKQDQLSFQPEVLEEFEMQAVSSHETPQGVLAVVDMPQEKSAPPEPGKFYLALDHIQDPGNMGTLIRIADWYQLGGVICSSDCTDCFAPKVVNSTMGSIFRTDIRYVNLENWMKSAQLPVYGALLEGENLHRMEAVQPGIILIGNEAHGIRPEHLPLISHKVTIPSFGKTESLNAAVAGAIIVDNLVQRRA